jgi:hypothetical protein
MEGALSEEKRVEQKKWGKRQRIGRGVFYGVSVIQKSSEWPRSGITGYR